MKELSEHKIADNSYSNGRLIFTADLRVINAFLQEVSTCNYSNLKAVFVVIIENCLIQK